MRGAQTFSEVLDATLKSNDINSFRSTGSGEYRPGRAVATPFIPVDFAQTTQRFAARAFESVAGALNDAARRVRFVAERPRPTPATTRPLSTDELRALDALIRHGASIEPNFTGAELQSAFRSLARRYHPDRHPHAPVGEKARLGTIFADLTSHYRRLVASGR
jgi:hypothetical protein